MNDYPSPALNIYLVGFMGSGKSTVGPLLAERLDFKFVDLDSLIEKQCGKEIADIFSVHGEDYFRNLETQALVDLSSKQKLVIALGGGAFVSSKNRELVEGSGVSVWLKVSFKEAARRCRKESHRPLARNQARFQELYKRRQPVYQDADIHVETAGTNPNVICDLILQKLSSVC